VNACLHPNPEVAVNIDRVCLFDRALHPVQIKNMIKALATSRLLEFLKKMRDFSIKCGPRRVAIKAMRRCAASDQLTQHPNLDSAVNISWVEKLSSRGRVNTRVILLPRRKPHQCLTHVRSSAPSEWRRFRNIVGVFPRTSMLRLRTPNPQQREHDSTAS
jgi:hypothetical protein